MARRDPTMPSPNVPMHRLQAVDHRLGPLCCSLARPLAGLLRRKGRGGWRPWGQKAQRRQVPEAARRVLCVKFWGLGSLQLLTPAARTLRERHPEARLVLLTLADNAPYARLLCRASADRPAAFDEVRTLEVGGAGWWRLGLRIVRLLKSLRRESFDEVYDFEFFTRFSALVSLATGAPRLHGFHSPHVWRGRFHDRRVPFNRYWHVARNFRALAGDERDPGDGRGLVDDLLPPHCSPEARERLDQRLAAQAVAPHRPLVVLNPNAGSLSLERRWPRERFAALAQALVDLEDATVVCIGSGSEAQYTRAVSDAVAAGEDQIVDLAGQLQIEELCALLMRADLCVSNDSGPMHVAAALGTPTVGLFGPETPHMYRPLGRRVEALWDPPVCSPCINVHDNKRSTCIHGRPECLMNLAVARVLASAHRMLAGHVLQPVSPPVRLPAVTPARNAAGRTGPARQGGSSGA